MTNREWLNNLSNEDLVKWLYVEHTRTFDPQTLEEIVFMPECSPSLHEITVQWTSAEYGLLKWLEEERKNENQIN